MKKNLKLKALCVILSLLMIFQAIPVNFTIFNTVIGTNSANAAVATLENGDFEEGSNFQPYYWSDDMYYNDGRTTYSWSSSGIGGSGCISINSTDYNDARVVQTVQVTPGKTYALSAYVKGENIIADQGADIGANICLMGDWTVSSSENSTGTFDWKRIDLTFVAPASGTVQIGCRLGFYSNLMKGTAYFDNVTLTEIDDFETGFGSTPLNWSTSANLNDGITTFTWEPTAGLNNCKCISINSTGYNDARWVQTIQLTPGKVYSLSAYVKGENIIIDPNNNGEIGANISVMGEWTASASTNSTGTFGWKPINFNFLVPESGYVTISCRLGFYNSSVKGKVYFDNLTISGVSELEERSGNYVRLHLTPSQWAGFTGTNDIRWINHLDAAYQAYENLVGYTPYGGSKINIMSSHMYSGWVAIAGNPIHWNSPYIADEIASINADDHWSFGILHELGHDFDYDGWNWDAEFWANTKMCYVLESLYGKVKGNNNNFYYGSQIENMYKSISSGCYDNTIAQGTYNNDGATYCFLRIKNAIGWTPFQNTFYYFKNNSINPSTKVAKFDLFLDKLSEYSNFNVRSTFLPGELDTIRNHLIANP